MQLTYYYKVIIIDHAWVVGESYGFLSPWDPKGPRLWIRPGVN